MVLVFPTCCLILFWIIKFIPWIVIILHNGRMWNDFAQPSSARTAGSRLTARIYMYISRYLHLLRSLLRTRQQRIMNYLWNHAVKWTGFRSLSKTWNSFNFVLFNRSVKDIIYLVLGTWAGCATERNVERFKYFVVLGFLSVFWFSSVSIWLRVFFSIRDEKGIHFTVVLSSCRM